MTISRGIASAAVAAMLVAVSPREAGALPTMVRLGYTECASCHFAPQGGGPLTPYGRGVDRAQSLRGGEYEPATTDLAKVLTLGGRVIHDLRAVVREQGSWVAGGAVGTQFRPRLTYRNVTPLGRHFSVSAEATARTAGNSLSATPSVFVNTALLNYRVGNTEISVGRDRLPSGIGVADPDLWTKSRNLLGSFDAPTQLKVFWNGPRVHLAPFVYRIGRYEAGRDKESGAGALAEVVLGERSVIGASMIEGTTENGGRRLIGSYARLGFGGWGILAEHDVTVHRIDSAAPVSFEQDTSYGQVFWAAREWLVVSAIGERLHVARPFDERRVAGKIELAARLASQATVSISTRLERDQVSGRMSKGLALQLALKTVR